MPMFVQLRKSLLIRLARTLRNWTDLLARRIERIECEPADSSRKELLPLRASGGPPAHWLELVRRHAPSLLQPPADRTAVEETATVFTSPIGSNGSRVSPAVSAASEDRPDKAQEWRDESQSNVLRPESLDRTGADRDPIRSPLIERHSVQSGTPSAPISSPKKEKAHRSVSDPTARSTRSRRHTPYLSEQPEPSKAVQNPGSQTADFACEQASRPSSRETLTSRTRTTPQTARSHPQDQDRRENLYTENKQPSDSATAMPRSSFQVQSNRLNQKNQAQRNLNPQPTGSVSRIARPAGQSSTIGAVQPRRTITGHPEPPAFRLPPSETAGAGPFSTNQALWPELPDEASVETGPETIEGWPSLPEDAWTRRTADPSAEALHTMPAQLREAQRRERVDREQQGRRWNG